MDIETQPHTVFAWGLWKQTIAIDQIAKSGSTICFAAKWLGEKEVIYSGHNTDSHKSMLQKIHKLLSEADAVVSYNGNKFDLPTLNKEFIKAGMAPPAPYKKIDLLSVARSQFKFTSNKLDYVAQFLGLGAKEKHKGMQLWLDCMSSSKHPSWKVMQKYNKQDVVLLERVYDKMLPWIPRHANWSVFSGKFCCPNCGSTNFQSRGDRYYKTLMGVYNRYQCNKCQTWFKDNKNQMRGAMKATQVGS